MKNKKKPFGNLNLKPMKIIKSVSYKKRDFLIKNDLRENDGGYQ